MLKLKMPSVDVKSEYKKRFLSKIVKRIKGELKGCPKLSNAARNVLLPGWNTDNPDTSILEHLLLDEPIALKQLNDELWGKLEALSCWNRPTKEELNAVFDYKGLIDQSKSCSYWLASKVGRNTCTYCNRTYILTIVKGKGENDSERIARPTFDHWYAHADYPLMSMSLCNLIPSCSICNSSVKSSAPFTTDTHIHPYVHLAGHPDLTFEASLLPGNPSKWTVGIKTTPNSLEAKTIEDLKLNEIYAYHGELEVRDLMEFREKYTEDYLGELVEKVLKDGKGSISLGEVYRMLFGTEIDEDKHLDRPLSKMKHDLLVEMGVI